MKIVRKKKKKKFKRGNFQQQQKKRDIKRVKKDDIRHKVYG